MKLKLDAAGVPVTVKKGEDLFPVYVRDDGTEVEFDVKSTVATINRLGAEAKNHRLKAEELQATVAKFAGIDDPAKALEAMQTVQNLNHKKLVDAGEVEKVKAEVAKVYEGQLNELKTQLSGVNNELYSEKVGGAFNRSKLFTDGSPIRLAIPPDLAMARFGEHFGIKAGKIYATDSAGNEIYSAARPGELADFDEALTVLVNQYPYKDQILRGSGASGGGAPANGGGVGGGGKTITRAAFDQLPVAQRAEAGKTMTVVD